MASTVTFYLPQKLTLEVDDPKDRTKMEAAVRKFVADSKFQQPTKVIRKMMNHYDRKKHGVAPIDSK